MENDDEQHRQFFVSWSWKREHLPDKLRFHRPYTYEFDSDTIKKLVIKQAIFKPSGFASTVWDSSIVVSKYLEIRKGLLTGMRCLDLSAGCGLVALVMNRCGAMQVYATDMEENLDLLKENCETNAPGMIEVTGHLWGESIEPPLSHNAFDIITACDLLYIREEEPLASLIKSLSFLVSADGQVLLAHGRNRGGEEKFRELSKEIFHWEEIEDELHRKYRCSDVKVVMLKKIQIQRDMSFN